MASKKLNKSAVIRDYKSSNPTALPKEIAVALAKSGTHVSAQFVSTVLCNAKKSGGKVGKRGPKPRASLGIDIPGLLAAKRFVEQIGGVPQARELIGAIAQLTR